MTNGNNTSFSGESLRLARTFLGLSQQEVGERLGVSRQFIHQIETESRIPSSDLIQGLCSVLLIEEKFLRTHFKSPVSVDQVYFRKLKRTPVSLVNQTLSFGTIADRIVNILENFVSLPPVDIPTCDVLSDEDAEIAALETRKLIGLKPDSPIKNLSRTLEKRGVIIFDFNNASSDLDALSISRARPIIIRSTQKQAGARVRFDLAHEFGHIVMHQGLNDHSDELEKQANRFAGCFLFPPSCVRREFPPLVRGYFDWNKIYHLKIRWGISVAAILSQALHAGSINAEEYSRGHRYLSKTRQKKEERFDDKISLERPELLRLSIQALIDSGIGAKSVIDSLGVSEEFFRRLIGTLGPDSFQMEASNVSLLWRR